MTIIRRGKCQKCRQPCDEQKVFTQAVDIFEPSDKIEIKGELAEQIRAWRKSPLYCLEHRDA